MDEWRLRLRAVLDSQFVWVLAVLVVCLLSSGWLTYTTHASPSTTTEQQSTVTWEQTGTFDHAATVQTENPLYPVGTRLAGRSVYYTRLAPELDGTFRTSYEPRDSGTLDQRVSLRLVIREVEADSEGDASTVYWRTNTSLAQETVEAVSPGESVAVSFTRDMSRVRTRIETIREELGGVAGEIEVFVRATVVSHGTINGEQVSETATYTMPVTVSETTYSVPTTEPTVEAYETTRTTTVDRSYGPIRSVGGPLLLVIALGSLGGLVGFSDRARLSAAERAVLAHRDDRETFDDWISTIELPPEAFELPRAEADSLSALVDFAIDTDNSVIEDPTDDAYYVRHDGYLYCYRPPTGVGDGEPPTADDPESAPEAPDESGSAESSSLPGE